MCAGSYRAVQKPGFLYANARYSEALDFALERAGALYSLRTYLQAIRSELAAEGYSLEIKLNDKKVHNAFVRFTGLLYELGLSSNRNEVISVKIEVDTNQPAGAVLATSVIRHLRIVLQQSTWLRLTKCLSSSGGELPGALEETEVYARGIFFVF